MCFIKVYGEWDSYKCVLLKCKGVGFLQVCLLKCMGSGILTSVFIKVYGSGILTSVFY